MKRRTMKSLIGSFIPCMVLGVLLLSVTGCSFSSENGFREDKEIFPLPDDPKPDAG